MNSRFWHDISATVTSESIATEARSVGTGRRLGLSLEGSSSLADFDRRRAFAACRNVSALSDSHDVQLLVLNSAGYTLLDQKTVKLERGLFQLSIKTCMDSAHARPARRTSQGHGLPG